VVYNTILDGCTRHKRTDLADAILKSMGDQGIIPTNFTLGILVKLYSRNRQLDVAFRVMETMPKQGNFVANAQVWTCLMCACLTNNAPDKAVKVFHDMKLAGQSPDTKTAHLSSVDWSAAAVSIKLYIWSTKSTTLMGRVR